MLELVVGRDSPGAPTTSLWFSVPAVAILVLPLFARRRFPFAAPAALLAAGRGAHVRRRRADPVHRQPRRRRAGGRVPAREPARRPAGADRPRRSCSAARRSSSPTSPAHATGDLVFIPAPFVVAWLAGYALRERAEQAEAAEVRATQAEREREAAARVAVAEERARIARELHDIVAHAVERDGAPGRRRPAQAPGGARGGQGGASGRRAGRPHRARRDAPPARRDAPRRRRRRARAPARASTASTRCSRTSAAPGFPSGCTSTASRSRSRARSTSPPTGSCRRA